MEDINLSTGDLERLKEGYVLLKGSIQDQYGMPHTMTIRFGDAENPRCGQRKIYGEGNKEPCVLPRGHEGDCPPDGSEETPTSQNES